MSFEATRRVWEHSQQKKMHLLLLAALAEMTNQRSEVCNPSVEYLADKIGVGERQAQRLLRELEESGELYAPPAVGRTRKTLYFVVVGLDAEEIAAVLVRQFEMTAPDAASLARELIELQGGEKVTSATEKVTFEVEKVTFPAEKVSPMSPALCQRANPAAVAACNWGGGGWFVVHHPPSRIRRAASIRTRIASCSRASHPALNTTALGVRKSE